MLPASDKASHRPTPKRRPWSIPAIQRLGDEHFRLRLIQHIRRNVLHTLAQPACLLKQSR